MSKILKNITGSAIDLDNLGLTIAASSQITINEEDYLLLGSSQSVSELTTFINSGDIVVNDGVGDLDSVNGLAFIQYPDTAANISFSPTSEITETTVQEAIGGGVSTALNTPRFSIPLIYNGTLSNNEFIGYSNLLPGDSTPIVVPINCILEEYTFSNSRDTADYTIELRKNSTTATIFNSISQVNTKTFVQTGINESFTQGDEIYIKYIDNGTNAVDAGLVLIFRAVP